MPRFFRRKRVEPEQVAHAAEPEATLPPAPDQVDGRRTVQAERDYLLSMVDPLPPFGMSLVDAWGLSICEDITADADRPEQDSAQVAGYAVSARDVAGVQQGNRATLRVRDKATKVGSAVEVQAGDVLPEGADAVIPLASAEIEGDVLTINRPVRGGDYVLGAGSLAKADVPLIRSNQVLDAAAVGLLGSNGIDKVFARPRPRVVVLAVGENLVEIGREPDTEQRRDVASHQIAVAAREDGAQVWRIPAVTDAQAAAEAIGDQIIRADLLITCGGLDGGRDSIVGEAVHNHGLSDYAQVAMQPSMQIGFALVGEDKVPLLMLPDDPVQALIGYLSFGAPLLRKLMGMDPQPQVTRAVTQTEFPASPGVTLVQPVKLHHSEGRRLARPLGERRATTLIDLVSADALVILPPREHEVPGGEWVDAWLLRRG